MHWNPVDVHLLPFSKAKRSRSSVQTPALLLQKGTLQTFLPPSKDETERSFLVVQSLLTNPLGRQSAVKYDDRQRRIMICRSGCFYSIARQSRSKSTSLVFVQFVNIGRIKDSRLLRHGCCYCTYLACLMNRLSPSGF